MPAGSSHRPRPPAPPRPPTSARPQLGAPRPAPSLVELARAARLQAAPIPVPAANQLMFGTRWSIPGSTPSFAATSSSAPPRAASTIRTAITASLVSLVAGALITLALQHLDAQRANATAGAEPVVNVPSAPRAAQRAAEPRSVAERVPPTEAPTSVRGAPAVAGAVPAAAAAPERAADGVKAEPARSDGARGTENAQTASAAAKTEPARSEAEIAYPDEPRTTTSPAAVAPPTSSGAPRGPFNRDAATTALNEARARAAACGDGKTTASARVAVSFAPSGRATTAVLEGDSALLGTPAGSCIARQMRSASVPAFDGNMVIVHTSVRLQGSEQ